MKLKSASHEIQFTLLFVVCLILFAAAQPGSAHALRSQEKERTLELTRHIGAPLDLVDVKLVEHSLKDKTVVKLRRQVIELSEATFVANDNWWKNLKFELKNTSFKTITAIRPEFVISLPDMNYPVSVPFTIYFMDGKRFQSGKDVLQPGAEFRIVLDEAGRNRVLELLREQGSNGSASKSSFDPGFIIFSDNTAWSKGVSLRRDSNDPTRWTKA